MTNPIYKGFNNKNKLETRNLVNGLFIFKTKTGKSSSTFIILHKGRVQEQKIHV